MANRRMFSKDITNSEEFLEMPDSTQKLYFHLGMNSDDDGFVSPKGVMRMVRAGEDDLKVLQAKGFIIVFGDNVIVITHWKMNNDIRRDRYKPTIYQEHLKTLGLTENNAYIKDKKVVLPTVLPTGNHLDTQVRLGKDRIEREETFVSDLSLTGKEETTDLGEKDDIEVILSDEDGNPLPPRKPKKAPKTAVVAFNAEKRMNELKTSSWPPERVLHAYWNFKGYTFDNHYQLKLQYDRDIKAAKMIAEAGYQKNFIMSAMHYCEENYKDVGWSLETILKKATHLKSLGYN